MCLLAISMVITAIHILWPSERSLKLLCHAESRGGRARCGPVKQDRGPSLDNHGGNIFAHDPRKSQWSVLFATVPSRNHSRTTRLVFRWVPRSLGLPDKIKQSFLTLGNQNLVQIHGYLFGGPTPQSLSTSLIGGERTRPDLSHRCVVSTIDQSLPPWFCSTPYLI